MGATARDTELFAARHDVDHTLAPDGTAVAWLGEDEGRQVVWQWTPDLERARIWLPIPEGLRAQGLRWSLSAGPMVHLDARDDAWAVHLFIDGHPVALAPGLRTRLLAASGRSDEVLLTAWRDGERHVLRWKAGVSRVEGSADPRFSHYACDRDLQLRAGSERLADASMRIATRRPGESWRDVIEIEADDAAGTRLIAADAKGVWLLTAHESDTIRLAQLGHDGVLRTAFVDEHHDVESAWGFAAEGRPVSVTINRGRRDVVALEEPTRSRLDYLRSRLSGDVQVVEADDSSRKWLVRERSSTAPDAFHIFDAGSADLISVPAQANLDQATMSPMVTFSFTSRDGEHITGYLTFPLGTSRRSLPTVMSVHPGPWVRESWQFNAYAQWLASMGFLVVMVNFRGSTGFGKRFVSLGDQQWGGTMELDLLDALNHVVELGYADPCRVGFAGSSYGGYASLMVAARGTYPIKCAISVSGPTNLVSMVADAPAHWSQYRGMLARRVGDPDADRDVLVERSPIRHVSHRHPPTLMVYGARDQRVHIDDARLYAQELRQRGVQVDFLEFSDEGHGVARPGNREVYLRRARAFLERHLLNERPEA